MTRNSIFPGGICPIYQHQNNANAFHHIKYRLPVFHFPILLFMFLLQSSPSVPIFVHTKHPFALKRLRLQLSALTKHNGNTYNNKHLDYCFIFFQLLLFRFITPSINRLDTRSDSDKGTILGTSNPNFSFILVLISSV